MTRLTLLPSDMSDGRGLPPGATIIRADCGHRAWISPHGLHLLAEHANMTGSICGDCAGPPYSTANDVLRAHPDHPGGTS